MPYTIDGTPARFRMLICVSRANRDLPAYSSRYTAQAMPMGKATTATMMQIHSVPQMASHRPASAAVAVRGRSRGSCRAAR